jgi:hypothetical protein
MKHLHTFESFLAEALVDEGVRKKDGSYEFDWLTDLPEDLMSLRFKKYRGRTQKVDGSDTVYTYYYAYQLEKSAGSTDLMKTVKMMEKTIQPKDLRMFVNKAVMGFDSTFGANNFNAIIASQSSSLILKDLVDQLKSKSGTAELFSEAFVKNASTDIKLDTEKVDKLPEKTKKEVMRAFKKATDPSKPFKIKEIFSAHRKFFREFMLFNKDEDRRLINAVEGQKIILVDDYKTSGTTIKEMIRQLADAGAAEVVVFVLLKLGE